MPPVLWEQEDRVRALFAGHDVRTERVMLTTQYDNFDDFVALFTSSLGPMVMARAVLGARRQVGRGPRGRVGDLPRRRQRGGTARPSARARSTCSRRCGRWADRVLEALFDLLEAAALRLRDEAPRTPWPARRCPRSRGRPGRPRAVEQQGNVCETTKFANQCSVMATPSAAPRTLSGRISGSITHTTGPHVAANDAMNVPRQTSVMMAAGRPASLGSAIDDDAMPSTARLADHPGQAGDEQRLAPDAVHEPDRQHGHRDVEDADHDVGVDRRLVAVADVGERRRRVVDDRVDPDELLEDGQPDRHEQRRPHPGLAEVAQAAALPPPRRPLGSPRAPPRPGRLAQRSSTARASSSSPLRTRKRGVSGMKIIPASRISEGTTARPSIRRQASDEASTALTR